MAGVRTISGSISGGEGTMSSTILHLPGGPCYAVTAEDRPSMAGFLNEFYRQVRLGSVKFARRKM